MLARGLKISTRMRHSKGLSDPDFLIIGGQRCGTTFLSQCLSNHTNVIPPLWNEIHYFTLKFRKSLNWYKAHFPTRDQRHRIEDEQGTRVITGEKTAYYAFHPLAAQRVYDTYPNIRLILLLRDPVERAISHYFHARNWGYEKLPIQEAMERDIGFLDKEENKIINIPSYYSFCHHHQSYISRGDYCRQIAQWEQLFPQEQLLILKSDEVFANCQRAVHRVSEFLEIPRREVSKPERTNAGFRCEAPQATIDWLRYHFEPANRKLYDAKGIDFNYRPGY
jgi:hypothetical protein